MYVIFYYTDRLQCVLSGKDVKSVGVELVNDTELTDAIY